MTRLLLVRHGESQVTVNRVIGGPRTCSGLSELGRRQAAQLRDRWAEHPEFAADVVVSSAYPRARETAEIVLPALGTLALQVAEGFGEHDPGPVCDGITYQEYVDRYSPGPDSWHDDDPFATLFPEGETIAAFHYRVGSALRAVIEPNSGSTIVVFCHGGVIDAILRMALKTASTGGFQIRTLNTSITELELVRRNTWCLHRYNDHAHLAGLPPETPRRSED